MTEFQDGPGNDGSGLDGSSTDRIIEGFARINEKVDAMRNQRLNDPDSLGDKAVKFALPSIAGFAALSAAVGAAVSQLSDRGSKALVARRHRRQSD